ncbi:MAG: hypothetical protein ACOH5I_15685 [Oligoflexus sp.]
MKDFIPFGIFLIMIGLHTVEVKAFEIIFDLSSEHLDKIDLI